MLPKFGRLATFAPLFVALLVLAACGGGDNRGRFAYQLRLTGLPDSATVGGHYEGWAIVDGVAMSTGRFIVEGSGPGAGVFNPEHNRYLGTASNASFGPSSTGLGEDFPYLTESSHLFITLEPEGDNDRVPSCNVILAGAIVDSRAVLLPTGVSVPAGFPCAQDDGQGGHFLGLQDFAGATGVFQLRSPTDDPSSGQANDFAGVWFIASTAAPLNGQELAPPQTFAPGLDLPPLAENLRYEGWAVVDGVERSLGRFRDPAARDEDAMIALQRGPDGPGYDFPGGDFVVAYVPPFAIDPPALDLTTSANFMDGDYRVFIGVEPERDNDLAPFGLEILSAVIPPDAVNANFQSVRDVALGSVAAALPGASATFTATSVTLGAIGLRELAANGLDRRGHYELWLDVAGNAQSCGRFLIDGTMVVSLDTQGVQGSTAMALFDAASSGNPGFPDPTTATSLFVTFEDESDLDATPGLVLLAGAAVGNQASLTVAGDGMGLGLADFSAVAGSFHLATPTDNDGATAPDDNFGVHFRLRGVSLDLFGQSLDLPALPAGWVYEGFVEDRASGRLYSTGRFRDPGGPDSSHALVPSAGDRPGFNLPGQDFVNDVMPAMYAAAQANSISSVFVTIETEPDDSPAPSFLRVLVAAVAPGTATATDLSMTLVFPATAAFSAEMSFEVTN